MFALAVIVLFVEFIILFANCTSKTSQIYEKSNKLLNATIYTILFLINTGQS